MSSVFAEPNIPAGTIKIVAPFVAGGTADVLARLVRTSFSSIVRESNDFACVVTDAQGRSIAQASNSIPSFIGTAPRTIRHFLEQFPPETLEEGDVLITNDVWLGTGHLPDITVAKPIFRHGTLVAWAGSVAHAPDIGGRVRSADATSVCEEGLQIPPMKVLSAGRMDRTLERILRQNVRVPDQVMGDLYAQFTALSLMERHTRGLMAEHGLESLEELSAQLRGRTEAAMRRAIAEVPDGVYRAEATSDGIDQPIRLKMALTVRGEEIDVDFAGSDPQVQKSINVCLAYTTAFTASASRRCCAPTCRTTTARWRPSPSRLRRDRSSTRCRRRRAARGRSWATSCRRWWSRRWRRWCRTR